MSRLHAVIHGRVQGVNFRAHTLRRATQLGLVGYVRNRADGTVEVVAEGEQKALRKLLSWLHAGPRLGHVIRVDARWQAPRGGEDHFEVRY
ncbi:MAG: acylphosphatase [Anaerolineae bacterium]